MQLYIVYKLVELGRYDDERDAEDKLEELENSDFGALYEMREIQVNELGNPTDKLGQSFDDLGSSQFYKEADEDEEPSFLDKYCPPPY